MIRRQVDDLTDDEEGGDIRADQPAEVERRLIEDDAVAEQHEPASSTMRAAVAW